MAEINHKWECLASPALIQRCVRCKAERKLTGKTSYSWLIDGVWKPMRLQPECTSLPKSERERSP